MDEGLISSAPVHHLSGRRWTQDVANLFSLAVPMFISSLAWVGMKTTDTALIGHAGTQYLSAAALSDLWTSSTGVLLQGGVLGVFVGNAVGAQNPKLAGKWLQVSLVVLASMLVPVIVCWVCFTGPILRAFGVEPGSLVVDAQYYAAALAFALPARVICSQVGQFFTAQGIVHPLVYTAIAALLLNFAAGLPLVLGLPPTSASASASGEDGGRQDDSGQWWRGFGFRACPVVTTCAESLQALLLVAVYCLRRRLHTPCWPGWAPLEHATRPRVLAFAALYFPAVLSVASDFWRMAAVGAVAAAMGPRELAVFTASYRVMWIALVFTGSLAGATAVRLSQALGAGHGATARYHACLGLATAGACLALLSAAVVVGARPLASVFSGDPEVAALFEQARLPLAATVLFMNGACALERVPLALGRSRLVFALGFAGSWLFQVPLVLLTTRLWRKDLVGLYTGVALGYACLCATLASSVATTDWQRFADEARARGGAEEGGLAADHDAVYGGFNDAAAAANGDDGKERAAGDGTKDGEGEGAALRKGPNTPVSESPLV